jgi:[CysO sulfur-carrier protein]-S-L-cysteine hydrolase
MINHSLPGSESESASRQITPASSIDRLHLPESIREQILIHLLDSTPNEGVGLLAIASPRCTDEGVWEATAVQFFPGTNVEASPSRFTMDPAEVVAAFRDIREAGWQLGAIVHSHLTGPATPSTTDVREAHYPEALLMIVSFADQPAHLRVWRVAREDDVRIVQPVMVDILHHE